MTQKQKSRPISITLSNPQPMTVILPENVYKALIKRSLQEGRPKAQMARRLIEKGLMEMPKE